MIQVVGENCPSYTYQILQGVILGTLTPPLSTPRSLYRHLLTTILTLDLYDLDLTYIMKICFGVLRTL